MKLIKLYENFLQDYSSFKKKLDDANVKFDNSVANLYQKEEEVLKDIFDRLSHHKNNFFNGGYSSYKGWIGSSFLEYLDFLIKKHRITKEFVNEELSKNTFRFGTDTDIQDFVLDTIATLSQLNSNRSIGVIVSFSAVDFWPESLYARFSNLNVPEISTDNVREHIPSLSVIPTSLSKLHSEEKFVNDIVRKMTPGQHWKEQKFLIAEFRLFFK